MASRSACRSASTETSWQFEHSMDTEPKAGTLGSSKLNSARLPWLPAAGAGGGALPVA